MNFADRDGVIWMDGSMVPWRDANVHVLTHSLHYGVGAFEGIKKNIHFGVRVSQRVFGRGAHAPGPVSCPWALPMSLGPTGLRPMGSGPRPFFETVKAILHDESRCLSTLESRFRQPSRTFWNITQLLSQ